MTEVNENTNQDPIRLLEYRNPLQVIIFNRLGIADDPNEVIKYSPIVHNIIDNPQYVEIRSLVLEKRFDEAADKIIAEIKQLTLKQAA